jgi:hypothetical protein
MVEPEARAPLTMEEWLRLWMGQKETKGKEKKDPKEEK